MRPTKLDIGVKVFISYVNADQELWKKLEEHLSPLSSSGKIVIWQDQEIPPGANWEEQVNTHLNEANLVLLLVSASFIASRYCWNNVVQIALERHRAGTARVIPILLKPALWQDTPLGELQALPAGAKPVTQWNDQDAALENVARGIRDVVEDLRITLPNAVLPPVEEPGTSVPVMARSALGPRVDWGDALAVPLFYGRGQERALLFQWIVQERCHVVSVLGMGGIGKSALTVSTMYQLAEHFEVVIFSSLRDTPALETLLVECLQVLSQESPSTLPATPEGRISLLLSHLRSKRALVVLDNVECLLEAGNTRGNLRPGFEEYGLLLDRVAETDHQSCLLLTSREKLAGLRRLEGKRSPVRTLRLGELDIAACKQLIEEKGVVGTEFEQESLISVYAGNPLALKIVAGTIVDLFGGEIGPFLARGTVIFGGITDLLREQFARLSVLEQSMLYWLAIVREPVTIDELTALLVTPLPDADVLEAIDAGHRRSLIERGKRGGSFTLQSVVLEYVTADLIAEASQEIKQGPLNRLIRHGLSQAKASEYVRQTQERLLLSPLLASLQCVYEQRTKLEKQLLGLLDELREEADSAQGYGPANLMALLRHLRGDLKGLDLSHLSIRGAYFQGIEMQDASLVGTTLRDAVWTSAFDAVRSVATSLDGKLWAAGTLGGEVHVWHEDNQSLHLTWQAHTDIVPTLAFSPNGRALVTVSYDRAVKLWDLSQGGALLWTGWHTDIVIGVAFSPDGCMLASCGNDVVVQLWDVTSGTNLQTLSGDGGCLLSLAWSPDGKLLASGGIDGSIRMWHLQGTQPSTCVEILAGHTSCVWALAFAPNGRQLVSGSWDHTVKLWEVVSGQLRQTLMGHAERVFAVAWSRDGRVVASAGFDKTICVFDVGQGSYRAALHGHTGVVYGIAFTPDSRRLLSGSDGTIRVWDIASGQCVRVVDGYAIILHDVAWSPDSTLLASADIDSLVTIWDVTDGAQPKVLRGHSGNLFGVVWSPDGGLLASSGRDNAIRLWDPTTGECRQVLRDPDHDDTMFYGVAWSPDGHLLACGSYARGVQVWNMVTRTRCWVGGHAARVRCVAWSPNSIQLAGCGDDGSICLWKASDGSLLRKLQGHSGRVMNVDWSPDGTQLVSGGGGRDGGELFIWDGQSGEFVQALRGHLGSVFALAWSPTGEVLVSGGSDGSIRWWEVRSGKCLRTCKGHESGVWSIRVSPDGRLLASCGNDGTIRVWDLERAELLRTLRHDRPYERLNITGIRGLNEAQKAALQALGAIEREAVSSL